MNTTSIVPSLGVGVSHVADLPQFVREHRQAVDYVEIVPDALWTDRGRGATPRYLTDRGRVAQLADLASEVPVVAHSIGLSIGSAQRFRHEHVAQMRRCYDWLGFPWHSDHLAVSLARHSDEQPTRGITMQIPRDRESLAQLIPRARKVAATVPVPFALENNAYYFDLEEEEFDDAEFLNRLCEGAGCFLILDLQNLYANSRNHGRDPLATLARLDLDRVIEIHVAAAASADGRRFGPVPKAVMDLLRYALLSCPNVGGVTLELPCACSAMSQTGALLEELARLRSLWRRYQPLPSRTAS